MSKYIVSVWPGVGYYTKQIAVEAFCEDEALEAAMCYCQKMGLRGLYIEANEVDEMDLSESEKDELYIYIDPTLCDSECRPAYFNLENLGIRKAA